jgi:hypothetical protein
MQNIYGLGEYNTEQIKEFAHLLKEEGLDESSIFARRPDASLDVTATIKSLEDEVIYIVPDALAGENGLSIVRALSLPQLEAIGAQGDANLKEAIKIKLSELSTKNPSDETLKQKQSYVAYSPAWQA